MEIEEFYVKHEITWLADEFANGFEALDEVNRCIVESAETFENQSENALESMEIVYLMCENQSWRNECFENNLAGGKM